MNILREPQVRLIALTHFSKPEEVPWETDTDIETQQLIEFAGRECYQSWSNPSGRTNQAYIANLLEHGHLSVLEHAAATFRITGISRACSHELVRHRHFSFSQLSQRYVPHREVNFIEPAVIASDPEAHRIFLEVVGHCQEAYRRLEGILSAKFQHVEDSILRRKLARQAARMVLPNATETRMVVTANFRALRHFFRVRCTEHADVEIRTVALKMLHIMQEVAPAVFGDFQFLTLEDGTVVARSPYPWD